MPVKSTTDYSPLTNNAVLRNRTALLGPVDGCPLVIKIRSP